MSNIKEKLNNIGVLVKAKLKAIKLPKLPSLPSLPKISVPNVS